MDWKQASEFGITEITKRTTRVIRTQCPHVLIADDDRIVRIACAALLTKQGCMVESVSSAEEAIDATRDCTFDMVLMDCNLPTIGGFEATSQIRANEPTAQQTPVFAFTAFEETEIAHKCLAAGMTGYLRKPLDVGQFRRLLSILQTC